MCGKGLQIAPGAGEVAVLHNGVHAGEGGEIKDCALQSYHAQRAAGSDFIQLMRQQRSIRQRRLPSTRGERMDGRML